ncbi:unnamed protein product [Paramecium sonneborni]|uniref:Uncharacterized protein n=1 Tax=Paramecium sonneborni TaxID=65129 RepID=A0A8S1RS34_9CILI|nr:unnamed protein product [Paramecium sonneborni]
MWFDRMTIPIKLLNDLQSLEGTVQNQIQKSKSKSQILRKSMLMKKLTDGKQIKMQHILKNQMKELESLLKIQKLGKYNQIKMNKKITNETVDTLKYIKNNSPFLSSLKLVSLENRTFLVYLKTV